MTAKLTETLEFDSLIYPRDVGTAPVTSAYVDVTDAGRVVLLAKAGAVTAAKILTVQAKQATSAAGAGAKNLGAAVTSVGVGGAAPPDVEIEFGEHDFDAKNGFTFVAVTLSIDEVGKLATAHLVQGNRRYVP